MWILSFVWIPIPASGREASSLGECITSKHNALYLFCNTAKHERAKQNNSTNYKYFLCIGLYTREVTLTGWIREAFGTLQKTFRKARRGTQDELRSLEKNGALLHLGTMECFMPLTCAALSLLLLPGLLVPQLSFPGLLWFAALHFRSQNIYPEA